MNRLAYGFVLLILLSMPLTSAHATCKTSMSGIVYCSRYPTGGSIVNDANGQVECGPGHCLKSPGGQYYCSRIEGGGAAISASGIVRCLGGCTIASAEMCVAGE
jgi:hypothetical protein